MSDELELLREFDAEVPALTEETRRRIYAYATQTARGRLSLTHSLTAALSRAAVCGHAPNSRGLRWGVALLALALASGGAAIAFTTAASGGQSVDDLLSQVQSNFGDHRLLSASVSGSTLTVNVAAPDQPSAISATFEAQILASAVRDAESASGQTSIDTVQFLDASDNAIPGYGPAPVGTDTSRTPLPAIPPLANGACNSAAQGVQESSLAIRSVLTLPYAGGACAFKFQASDPSNFDAPSVIGKLVSAMGNPNQRAYLVEVDDQTGVPQFVYDYTPGGGGVAYTKPGSNIIFGP